MTDATHTDVSSQRKAYSAPELTSLDLRATRGGAAVAATETLATQS